MTSCVRLSTMFFALRSSIIRQIHVSHHQWFPWSLLEGSSRIRLLQQSVCRNTSACRSIVPLSLEHCGSSELQRLDPGDRGVSQRLHDALRNRNSSIRHQIHVSHHRWFPRSLMEASSRIHEFGAMFSQTQCDTISHAS